MALQVRQMTTLFITTGVLTGALSDVDLNTKTIQGISHLGR